MRAASQVISDLNPESMDLFVQADRQNVAGQSGGLTVSDAHATRAAVREIAEQIRLAMPGNGRQIVEVSYGPKELGSISITLSTMEGSIGISILTERPETLELLRRHIDQLTAALRDLGFQEFDLDIGGRQPGGHAPFSAGVSLPDEPERPPDELPAAQQIRYRNRPAGPGVDLRV